MAGGDDDRPARKVATVSESSAHWDRPGLGSAILDALAAAGKDLDALTVDDLAPADQFHGGGKPATLRLPRAAGLEPGTWVLDVGGGLGGPARVLAAEFGCTVTVVDLTPSYVEAAGMLTARLGLEDRVRHEVADALDLPFEHESFDVVWTQNSGMNIADKAALYASFRRVLRMGGTLALQEPVAAPGGPPALPLMWAEEASSSFLSPSGSLRELIEAAGFTARSWEDVSSESVAPSDAPPPPAHSIQRLVMGDRLEVILRTMQHNLREGRVRIVQGVFDAT
jgi:SAM-dependent methyltransferase